MCRSTFGRAAASRNRYSRAHGARALSMLLLLFAGPLGRAEVFTMYSDLHPYPSHLTIQFYLGTTQDPLAVPLGALGPLPVTASFLADVQLNSNGDGTFEILSSSIVLASDSGTLDLGTLGTLDYVLNGLGFYFASGPRAVLDNLFAFYFDDVSTLIINQGVIEAFNPTGVLATLDPNFYVIGDYGANPLTADPDFNVFLPFLGLVDAGAGQASPAAEIQFGVPSFATQLIALTGGLFVYGQLVGSINVAAVPEPPGWLLAASGAALATAALRRAQRRVASRRGAASSESPRPLEKEAKR